MKNLILVGGGGHCKSVLEAAESAGYNILGVLDMPEEVGKEILSTKVIGTDDDINKIKEAGGKLATVIASTAYVSKYAEIGEGTVVLHQAFVNAGAKVGKNVILNTATNIEHDAVISDQCHISTGAMINGGAEIAEGTFIGSQSVINQGIKIKWGGNYCLAISS